ncbi:MAG: alpha/beta hydrolase [Patescibacteria group bacterium]
MKESFFEERGICYRINEFVAGRTTLVFIHGLSGSASAWFPFEALFSADYNIVTFDLRGHGNSIRPRHFQEYALTAYADDLHALLGHLHIETCVLVSHSLGALVALEYLTAHPGTPQGVVFLSPSSFLKQTRWFFLIRSAGRLLALLGRILPFFTKRRGRVLYAQLGYTSDWDLRRIIRDLRVTTLHAYVYCLVQAYEKDYDELWESIAVPTLILHGTRDTYIPLQHSRRLAEVIPGAQLVVLEGANHLPVLNNISAVAQHIRTFVASVAPR